MKKIKIRFSLMQRLLPLLLGGLDKPLDKNGKLYLILLCRLIDKSIDEYNIAYECTSDEIRTKDRLRHRFQIVNHLENSLSATDRTLKVFRTVLKGKVINKDEDLYNSNNIRLINYLSPVYIGEIQRISTSKIRNRIEHIDEDINDNKIIGNLSLDIDDKYELISINGKSIAISEYEHIIESCHRFMDDIFSHLPNRYESGIYSRK